MELKPKDLRHYSLRKLIESVSCTWPVDGLEGEVSSEIFRECRQAPVGHYVPWSALTRDLNTTLFSQGGALVQTSVADSVIPLLRNSVAAVRLGATTMTGLKGNLA